MTLLLITAGLLVLAVLAPWIGTDSSDARAEGARPHHGWWPAHPGVSAGDDGRPS